MQRNSEIIDVECREIRTLPARRNTLLAVFAFIVPAQILCLGGVFNLWSGTFAMTGLLLVAAISLLIGLNIRTGRRISGITGLTMLSGLIGTGLLLLDANRYLTGGGMALIAIALILMKTLERKEWLYE